MKDKEEVRFKVRNKKTGLFAVKNSASGGSYGGVHWNKSGTLWNKRAHLVQAFNKENSLGHVKKSDVEVAEFRLRPTATYEVAAWLSTPTKSK